MMISDRALDEYYAKDYYGAGTNYFDPPDWVTEDDLDEVLDEVIDEILEEEYV